MYNEKKLIYLADLPAVYVNAYIHLQMYINVEVDGIHSPNAHRIYEFISKAYNK